MRQAVEDGTPGGVGQGSKYSIECLCCMFNHVVKYREDRARLQAKKDCSAGYSTRREARNRQSVTVPASANRGEHWGPHQQRVPRVETPVTQGAPPSRPAPC